MSAVSVRANGPVVCFGELMLRLSPPGDERFLQSPAFRTWFGGSEANVALGLSHLGSASAFVTALPPNPIGDAALAAVRAEGADVSHIVRSGQRLGIYYVERGADVRPMRVVYDRAHSAFAELDPASFDWHAILEGASWLHLSGITPSLGEGPAIAAIEAARAARARGVPVSLDLNYRPALWAGRDPVPHMRPLAESCDLLIGNAGAVQAMLGVSMPAVESDALRRDASWHDAARRVHSALGCALVAFTRRDASRASVHHWSTVLFDAANDAFHSSREWTVQVVDRVGGGDSFVAGFLHARLLGRTSAQALEFATAASALKLTVAGDFNRVSTAEVDRLLEAS